MKATTVGSLMVPVNSYATVPVTATLVEALLALERAQSDFDPSRYRHRAILVVGRDAGIVGKLSQMDVVKALDPDIGRRLGTDSLARHGIDDAYIEFAMDRYQWLSRPLRELCGEAGRRKVSDCMHVPSQSEFVQRESTLQEAAHRLILGGRDSLLVTEGDRVVGVLRLTDVFSTLIRVMRESHEYGVS